MSAEVLRAGAARARQLGTAPAALGPDFNDPRHIAVADLLDAVASGADSGNDLEWSHPRDVFAASAVARAYLNL